MMMFTEIVHESSCIHIMHTNNSTVTFESTVHMNTSAVTDHCKYSIKFRFPDYSTWNRQGSLYIQIVQYSKHMKMRSFLIERK